MSSVSTPPPLLSPMAAFKLPRIEARDWRGAHASSGYDP